MSASEHIFFFSLLCLQSSTFLLGVYIFARWETYNHWHPSKVECEKASGRPSLKWLLGQESVRCKLDRDTWSKGWLQRRKLLTNNVRGAKNSKKSKLWKNILFNNKIGKVMSAGTANAVAVSLSRAQILHLCLWGNQGTHENTEAGYPAPNGAIYIYGRAGQYYVYL